ncbi:MAG: PDZ domain-containing protein [Planctomycetota bacterium]
MIRGLLTPLLLLSPALLGQRPGEESPPARQQERATQPLAPALLGLSRELARLRRSADCVVRLTRRVDGDLTSAYGIHLGEGLVATNHVAAAEAGTTWTLTDSGRSMYRALSLGSSRSYVSFFWLRDQRWHDPLPVPRRRAEDAGELGDLVLILGRGKSRLEILRYGINLLHHSGRRGFGAASPRAAQRGSRGSRSGGRPRNVWMLNETEAKPGSVVLAMDGSVVGLLVRREAPGRPDEGRSGQQEKMQERSERGEGSGKPEQGRQRRWREGSFSFILGPALLLERAKRLAKPEVASEIKLGVSFFRRRRRRPSSKLRVTAVMLGSPAARSGVQVQDCWVTANGRPLTGLTDLEGLLGELEPGQELRISYLRGHDQQPKKIVIRLD